MPIRGRGKGPGGMTIKGAVYQVIHKLKRATGMEIFQEVKKIYSWGDHAIWRHIMALTINLQPGYYEWGFFSDKDKCLFLQNDGYFELYNRNQHGSFSDGIKIS